MIHYIYGSGMHGCIYDFCGASDSLQGAVDSLTANFEFGRSRKARLFAERYLELRMPRQTPGHKTGCMCEFCAGDGAEYCEIIECQCATPWAHDENSRPEDWPNYTEVSK
jgi:hypothetical protein